MNQYKVLRLYVEAREELDRLKYEREITTKQLEQIFRKLKEVNNFNYEPQTHIQAVSKDIEMLLTHYQTLSETIAKLIREINQYAGVCNSEQLEIK